MSIKLTSSFLTYYCSRTGGYKNLFWPVSRCADSVGQKIRHATNVPTILFRRHVKRSLLFFWSTRHLERIWKLVLTRIQVCWHSGLYFLDYCNASCIDPLCIIRILAANAVAYNPIGVSQGKTKSFYGKFLYVLQISYSPMGLCTRHYSTAECDSLCAWN